MKDFPLVKLDTRDRIDGNYHGPNCSTVTRGFLVTRMGAHCMSIGLWCYRSDGSARLFNLAFPRWRPPFPEKPWHFYVFPRFRT